MAVVTGTNRTNISDIIDQVRSDLVTNRGWTQRRNTGSVGSNNIEVWLERPAANTKNGERILVGLRPGSQFFSKDTCELRQTHLDWTASGGAGGAAWASITGMNASQTPLTTHFSTGANFLRHWIITPPDTTATPADYQYCYVVVEVATGVYRMFGFGESIKFGTWTGGQFIEGSWIEDAAASTNVGQGYFAAGDAASTREFRKGVIYCNSVVSGADKYARLAPGILSGFVATYGMGPQILGEDFIVNSPAAFSGQTQRIPAQFYMADAANSFTANLYPLCQFPDIFHCNIRDLDPGSVVVDDTFRFLVVPYYAKSGTNNSGNLGFLIRNPAL